MQNYPITRSQGNFSWPNGGRIAVVLTSEYEPVYEIKPLAGGQPNYRQMAEMRYEATRGIWRILDVLKRHGVVSTFFVNGATAKEYPESVKAIAAGAGKRAHHRFDRQVWLHLAQRLFRRRPAVLAGSRRAHARRGAALDAYRRLRHVGKSYGAAVRQPPRHVGGMDG